VNWFDTLDSPTLPVALPAGSGYGACWNDARQGYDIVVPDGELFYAKHFFSAEVADRCVEYLQANDTLDATTARWKQLTQEELDRIHFTNINWRQEYIQMFGKRHALPRLTAWYGDAGKYYTYSNITMPPNPWNKGLFCLKQQKEQYAGSSFNSVLLNWYRDGEDHMHWHADDEPELGRNPVIASVNFGLSRDFVIRRNDDHKQKIVLPLGHGTLLIMRGALQHFWQHAVPKRKRVRGSRFNLTFRCIEPD